MSEESITPPFTTDKSFYPKLIGSNDANLKIKFKGIYFKFFRNKTISIMLR